MKKNMNDLLCVVLVAVLVNLVVPMVLKPLATEEEIKPTNGAANLSFKGQLMHMFVHHAQVPVSSSVVVAVIVAVSVGICMCCKM